MSNNREEIENGLKGFGRTIYRNRLKTLLITRGSIGDIVLPVAPPQARHLDRSLFHASDPALITDEAFREQFGRDEVIVVAVRPLGGVGRTPPPRRPGRAARTPGGWATWEIR